MEESCTKVQFWEELQEGHAFYEWKSIIRLSEAPKPCLFMAALEFHRTSPCVWFWFMIMDCD